MQAVVTITTYLPVTVPQPVIVTSSKVTPNPQVVKAGPEGQGKKANEKGKVKPLGKGKKNVAKSTTNAVTTAGPTVNLHSNLRDKAKDTAVLMQEITEELQAIEEES